MSYREIFVHLDSADRSDYRCEVSFELARRFGASLNCLFGECDPYLANLASQNISEQFAQAATRAEAHFKDLTAEAEIPTRWNVSISRRDGALTNAVAFGARHSDLAVLGQHSPQGMHSGVPSDLVEQVVLYTGRPVLVIPFTGDVKSCGRRIMIGWNAGREAVRAVHDALPFLQSSEEVTLVAVNPWQEERGHGLVPGADMANHLKAHGVKATSETRIIEGMSPMETLLSYGAERSVDLLVVGAHGHYGFPDLLRGSGTKHLLKHMTVPVLMSH